jgi:hypothetical protein
VSGDASPESVEKFVERFGSDRFVHRGRSYTVIGYNSNNIKNRTAASEAEYEWIEQQLRRARKNRPIIVVSHHPYFLKNADFIPENFQIPRFFIRESAVMKKLSTFLGVKNVESFLSKNHDFPRVTEFRTGKSTGYQHSLCWRC